jgi:hypothetical protein
VILSLWCADEEPAIVDKLFIDVLVLVLENMWFDREGIEMWRIASFEVEFG